MIYIARYVIELTAPMHCGGGKEDGIFDAPVTRDAFNFWRISGSSIAGALRSRLQAVAGGAAAESLFGAGGSQEDSRASLVWCSDAILLDWDNTPAWQKSANGEKPGITSPSFIRDHVRIDPRTGAAADAGKFDEEYVPAGARFAFEVTLDSWGSPVDERELAFFGAVLSDVENGNVQFGGKAGTGYGGCKAVVSDCRVFDLARESDLTQWLKLKHEPAFPAECGLKWKPQPLANEPCQNAGIEGTVEIPLKAASPFLIGGGFDSSSDANLVFATTAVCSWKKKRFEERHIIPGSSLKGVLRHRCERIVKALGVKNGAALIDGLFGSIEGDDAGRSRMRVFDAELVNAGTPVRVPHVAIDRFTGGAMDGCLYSEAPVWSDKIQTALRLRLDDVPPETAAVLLQAVMDMAQGELSIGSGGNRGNGIFTLGDVAGIKVSLIWGKEHLTEKDTATAEDWLERLDSALKGISA